MQGQVWMKAHMHACDWIECYDISARLLAQCVLRRGAGVMSYFTCHSGVTNLHTIQIQYRLWINPRRTTPGLPELAAAEVCWKDVASIPQMGLQAYSKHKCAHKRWLLAGLLMPPRNRIAIARRDSSLHKVSSEEAK